MHAAQADTHAAQTVLASQSHFAAIGSSPGSFFLFLSLSLSLQACLVSVFLFLFSPLLSCSLFQDGGGCERVA